MTYTRQFHREELIEHAKRIAGNAERSQHFVEADAMNAIVAILENYPLANVAAHAVDAMLKDLRERNAFQDLLNIHNTDYPRLKQLLIEAVASKVVYATPITKTAETDELDLGIEALDLELT